MQHLVLSCLRHIAPAKDLPSLARTTQASQQYAVGVLSTYRLIIYAEFDQAQACIRLRRNDSSAHHIAPLPPRRQVLAVLLPTSDQTGLEGLPLRVLPSFSSYCLRLAMAAPYPKLPPAYPNEGEDQGYTYHPSPTLFTSLSER